MRCPACGCDDTRVIDSRASDGVIRRRRECPDCSGRFTTHERVEERLQWVLKRDGRREPFQREKVLRGVALACRKRPVDAAAQEALVRRVEARLAARDGEVTSRDVGEAVLVELRTADPVATVRFASVYGAFESVEQFLDVVAPLRSAP
jgi:transcriptional repressor NrdR